MLRSRRRNKRNRQFRMHEHESRGRHLKRYSVIAITLNYVFALSYNVLTLWRNVVASISYRSEHIGADITYDSYCSKLIDQRYHFY
jgi:hypothetical protein